MNNHWKVRANAGWKQDYERLFRQMPKRQRRHIAKIKLLKHIAKNAHEQRICT